MSNEYKEIAGRGNISVRLSTAERTALERAAQRAGIMRRRVITTGEYAREAIVQAAERTLAEQDQPLL